eukprot:2409164-Rhodomonas_salina.1
MLLRPSELAACEARTAGRLLCTYTAHWHPGTGPVDYELYNVSATETWTRMVSNALCKTKFIGT